MTETFSIRPATVEDVRVLAELRFRMFEEIDPDEELTEDLFDVFAEYFAEAVAGGRYLALLADVGGAVIGTVGAAVTDVPPLPRALDGRVARVQSVFVVPEWRRRGVARALLAELLQLLRAEGLCHVALMATDEGRALYEEFGFETAQEMVLLLESESGGGCVQG